MTKPNNPISLRLSAACLEMMAEIEKSTGLKRSAIVELAIRRFHKDETANGPNSVPDGDSHSPIRRVARSKKP